MTEQAATSVAFLGLGVMGGPMAGHLAKAGHAVTVWNRTPDKAKAWAVNNPGRIAATAAEAAAGAHFVFACVGDDDSVRAVTTGPDGAFAGMGRGAVFIDHTTASATVARDCHAAAQAHGIHFLDAPVSGGEAGAVNGVLTVMVGGAAGPFERAAPLIGCFARSVRLMGGPGAGQLTKMVNQICIAGLVQGLSEGLALAEKAGLDAQQVVEVISKGAAQSWQMDNRATTMIDGKFDFGFAVDWMRKDLGIALAEGRRVGARLPVTALVDQFYADVQAAGGHRWDTSSLITRLR